MKTLKAQVIIKSPFSDNGYLVNEVREPEELKEAGIYYFNQIWNGSGNGNKILYRGVIEYEDKLIKFKILKKREEDLGTSLIEVDYIEDITKRTMIVYNENKRVAELRKINEVYKYLGTEKAYEGWYYVASHKVYKDENDIFYVTDDDRDNIVTKIGTDEDLTKFFEPYA